MEGERWCGGRRRCSRRTGRRGRLALAGAALLWLAFAAWFVVVVVLPS
ncbi:hypothetical protein [Jiangella aurantiaca]|nr:hypothetical protein [Jiangella aurantiaca]